MIPASHRFLLTTTNAHKVKEWKAILPRLWPQADLIPLAIEVDETELTFRGNARLKADAGWSAESHQSCGSWQYIVGEDAGLIIPALNGVAGLDEFPGVRSNRWLTPDVIARYRLTPSVNEPSKATRLNTALLQLMVSEADRSASYCCSLMCHVISPSDTWVASVWAEGVLALKVAGEASGDYGFGYDPVMLLDDGRSIGSLPPEEKNRLSHRQAAITKLVSRLQGLHDGVK